MAVPPTKVSHTKRSIVIAVAVIALLVVAGVVIEVLTSNQVQVNGTYMNIWYSGPSGSGYFGQTSKISGSPLSVGANSIFTESLTIKNNATAPGGGTGNLSIAKIAIDQQQFLMQSISPGLPYSLDPGSSVTFKFSIRAPGQYSGPLTYTITIS